MEETRKAIRDAAQRQRSQYRYPVSDASTDRAVARQDPDKRRRELALLRDAVPADARIVCEIGCGTGRNLDTLRGPKESNRYVFATEPDAERARSTRTLGYDCIEGDAESLECLNDATIDHAVLCQVLGHAPLDYPERVFRTLDRVARPGANVHLLIPFDTTSSDDGGDLLHIADLGDPPDPDWTTLLLDDQYEAMVRGHDRLIRAEGREGRLPVRGFHIDTESVAHIDAGDMQALPVDTGQMPQSIARAMPQDTRVEWIKIYSVHQATSSGPQRGDMSILLQLPE